MHQPTEYRSIIIDIYVKTTRYLYRAVVFVGVKAALAENKHVRAVTFFLLLLILLVILLLIILSLIILLLL